MQTRQVVDFDPYEWKAIPGMPGAFHRRTNKQDIIFKCPNTPQEESKQEESKQEEP